MSETVIVVATVERLVRVNTKGLRPGTLGFVGELDCVPPRDPEKPRAHWTGQVLFVDKLRKGGAANGDTVIAAKSGGFWCRVRDVP